jgi:phosphatidylglycerophosphatase A
VNRFLLWIAQGFGLGQIPFAPGTFGSILGLIWFLVLLRTGNVWVFLGATLAGLPVSIWLCGLGERALRRKDPQSVVLDEVVAMPFCFTGWLGIVLAKTGSMPQWEYLWADYHWLVLPGVFVAFRFFDVRKPWPVRQSQSLPGGWGVTVDDALAAVYVNLVVFAVYGGLALLG